jgi:hypothetical protein
MPPSSVPIPEGRDNSADQLPIKSDFLNWWSRDLDEQYAVKKFLGKTPDEAEEMFRRDFLSCQEDLGAMKATAIRFYLLPAIRYLLSESATGDSDAASTFCFMLEQRLKLDPDSLAPVVSIVLDTIRQILEHFARFDCSPEIYGDVPARYEKVAKRLEAVKA